MQIEHNSYYTDKLKEHGSTFEAVGYKNRSSQTDRFAILSEILPWRKLMKSSVLDVGCGVGDFYEYLDPGVFEYRGIDAVPELIEAAKEKYPRAFFECANILEYEPDKKFDVVLACSVFNINQPMWQGWVYEVLKKMFGLCKVGIGATLLSQHSPWQKRPDRAYVWPSSILDFALRYLGNKAVIRHDYRPNDFTIFVYK